MIGYVCIALSLVFLNNDPQPVTFEKQLIAMESAESVGVFDVDGDGIHDLVSGSYWYKGPEFTKRQLIGQVKRVSEYFDDFSTIPMDVNGDGKMDYVTGGWFGKTLFWAENPGTNGEWDVHEIANTGNVETSRAWDVDGDGHLDIVPNTPNQPLAYYTLNRDAEGKGTKSFDKHPVIDKHGHGLGFGDINGDGRGDFIIPEGWLEAPEDLGTGTWKLHPSFELGGASVPILVEDVNGDGLNDLIVGQGHDYGLHWYQQQREGERITFIKRPIDPYQSQYHTMEWADIDNDGQMELITGKRYRAHNGNDPGANDHLGLYYFKWNGESFTKNIISYGPFGEGKGAGLYFSVEDLNGNGLLDIVVAGKDGLVVFHNKGSR
ncbi:FG-GAP repeat domain-containing protein [Cyclobacterium jeungdonense]|uniref:VCBS repeat-containing protein n=1 Tax=Cyclobacterium jeungdonense TaxID=708087 RepID=A0ABT8C8H7_9BACT|nr:VCBS repeat-containing protein [Cyclobacterium jeungdonense]MDN3687928.1 VCBS repeat-containing protein [Cyclobacterium jeungdonense]